MRHLWRGDRLTEARMLAKREWELRTYGQIVTRPFVDSGSLIASLMMIPSWESERVKIRKGEV
jgi:hypothetical protein